MEQPQPRKFEMNLFQGVTLEAARSGIKRIDAEAGRGIGKSTVFGVIMRDMAVGMPRGKVALSGQSYRQMLGDTLPSTVEGLERVGLYKNIHYFVGNDSAPRKLGWYEAYQPPQDYVNCIRFWTGFTIVLMSQDKSTIEHRGHNFDGELGDERAGLDPVRLFNEVSAGNRTKRPEFEKCPLYRSAIYMGSTPMTREGAEWLAGEEYAAEHPGEALWIRANAWQVNRHNLAADWFEMMRLKAPSEMHYLAEVMNVRPRLTVAGFYPALSKKHYYTADDGDYYLGLHADRKVIVPSTRADMDYNPDRPLIVCIDPGSKINVAVVKQLVPEKREQRTLRSRFRKYPVLIQTLVEEEVLDYYGTHRHKVVELFIGRDANMRVPNSNKTVADDVVDAFRKRGWVVHLRTMRVGVQLHNEKYHLLAKVLEENDTRLYKVRINKDHNRDLIISLENAEAIDTGNEKIRKDKRSESRLATVPAQHATHFSDAWDFSEVFYAKKAMNESASAFKDVRVIG